MLKTSSNALLVMEAPLSMTPLLSIEMGDLIKPTRLLPFVGLLLHPAERLRPSKTGEYNDGMSLENAWALWLGELLLRLAIKAATHAKLFTMACLHCLLLRATQRFRKGTLGPRASSMLPP